MSDAWVVTRLDDPDNLQIRVLDARTGKEADRWKYRSDFRCGDEIQWQWKAIFHGRFVYLAERCGDRVARFPRGGARKPLRRYATLDGGRWVGGPHQGMLFFVDAHHRLLGVHLDGGRSERIGGVLMPTGRPRHYETTGAQIVRLDLDRTFVYVSRRDGWFHILDFRSGSRLISVRGGVLPFGSEAEEYAPPIRIGSYLIVHPQGEVLVLRAPR